MSDTASRPGLLRRIWRFLASPSGIFSLGLLLIAGFAAGVLFWGGFHTALEMTNKESFCISCHEMNDNVFAEYQGSIHQNNRSGVRATCPDCHVPKEWGPKMLRKIKASKELYGHFISKSIWTPEKFAERRIELAANEWTRMKKNDSQECRNCHNFDFMDFTMQENRAAADHQRALDAGKTCIDCHQGIAHDLPGNYLDRYQQVVHDLESRGVIPAQKPQDAAEVSAYLDEVSGG
ncbi:NapC/NirT family cytochrome c [Cereibacter sphaeroides]|uniref:NapC/NirT family cytochrome c n=1 Tax=Cereibacter sphaeroides TaxID=1063 RepID=UPI001F47E24F|nr:NapC/NirT family cytochrome c [Cereibacter sphaeroides]MCE6968664.1 NapC/NirT family cytochrome c [Cereibacter sphaeroides]